MLETGRKITEGAKTVYSARDEATGAVHVNDTFHIDWDNSGRWSEVTACGKGDGILIMVFKNDIEGKRSCLDVKAIKAGISVGFPSGKTFIAE